MTAEDRFRFYKSAGEDGITLLKARMNRFAYPRHAHEEYSFGVTLSGDQQFFSRGSFYTSRPGNVILFNPDDIHDGNAGGEGGLDYLMLYIPPETLIPYLKSSGWAGGADFRLRLLMSEDPSIHNALLRLSGSVGDGKGNPLYQEDCLFDLALALTGAEGTDIRARPDGRLDTLLSKAKDYIQSNIREDISLDALGRELDMSKFHFLRLFREQVGTTPYQYILSCRVEQARKALLGPQTVSDIAYEYGFADLSHFNRRFKAVFGVTPTRYRKNLLN